VTPNWQSAWMGATLIMRESNSMLQTILAILAFATLDTMVRIDYMLFYSLPKNNKHTFSGTLTEPHCYKSKCNVEIHYGNYLKRQCIPIYYKDLCCPIEWKCRKQYGFSFILSAPFDNFKF
jgi:hypothetical protein